jgi:hypothetical protein
LVGKREETDLSVKVLKGAWGFGGSLSK